MTFEEGRIFRRGLLLYRPDEGDFVFEAVRVDGTDARYAGRQVGSRLVMTEVVEEGGPDERVVLHPLHDNRYLFTVERRRGGRGSYRKAIEAGCTREGVPFVKVDPAKACRVTGGQGTIAVTFEGKTYYVCCSGCKDAFEEDPAKFVDK